MTESNPGVPSPGAPANWNPPSGDISLDDLFPNPELTPQAPAAPATPPAPAAPEYFLKAATGTVYKTAEDAVRGTEEKDRTIERLKSELAKHAPAQPAATPGQPASFEEYATSAFDKLAEAAQKGDKIGYVRALGELQMATLAPYAPLITEVASEKAIRQIESEVPNFRGFMGSNEYSETLERFPSLKNAIETAKQRPELANQLPEFYRLVHNAHVASKASQISADAARASQPAPTPNRPTLSPSTPTPVPNSLPQRGIQMTREQLLADRDARKEFLRRYEQERGGALEQSWSSLGL